MEDVFHAFGARSFFISSGVSKCEKSSRFAYYAQIIQNERGCGNVSRTAERRQMIIERLSFVRSTTYQTLAYEFGVSKDTIRNDIAEISLSVPLYTVPGHAGGIRVMDGWYASRCYLHDKQADLLRALLPSLDPEQQKIMQSILDTFAKPMG